MKSLLYKEFKLAMHPICYIFIILFPLMILIPTYPLAVGFLYVLTIYPILFLGANKGQQSNDLLFSTLLPVRKKDIVLARMITIMICQAIFIALSALLLPLAMNVENSVNQAAIESGQPVPSDAISGLGKGQFVSVLGFVLIAYGICDLIYFAIYYKKGKSIVASTLISILFYVVFMMFTTMILPEIEALNEYKNFFVNGDVANQLIILAIGLLIYIVLHFFTYKISSKELEKVDF